MLSTGYCSDVSHHLAAAAVAAVSVAGPRPVPQTDSCWTCWHRFADRDLWQLQLSVGLCWHAALAAVHAKACRVIAAQACRKMQLLLLLGPAREEDVTARKPCSKIQFGAASGTRDPQQQAEKAAI
jgi:hypothetical protein